LDAVYSSSLTYAASKYAQIEGNLPRSPQELTSLLSVQPGIEHERWDCGQDRLEVGASFEHDDRTTVSAAFTAFKLGSRAHEEHIKRTRESQVELLAADLREGRERACTGGDIRAGRWSNYYWDNRCAYSDGLADFKQLVWSLDLAKVLFVAAKKFQLSSGAYPASPVELLGLLGEVSPEAWVAPATGSPTMLEATYTGEDPAHICPPDRQSCETMVPLFSSGKAMRGDPDGPKMSPDQGYYPGECVRYATGMMVTFP